jgi:hypothetical protein
MPITWLSLVKTEKFDINYAYMVLDPQILRAYNMKLAKAIAILGGRIHNTRVTS